MAISSVLLPSSGQRVLVVQAHPDDAEHLCGGTIALLAAEGKEIHYLMVTRGDQGYDDPEMTPERLSIIREQEQRQAAQVLGVQTVTFLEGYHDSEVEASMTLRRELTLAIRQQKPDTIFTFDPWRKDELHPDHRAVSICTVDAVACARTYVFPEQLQNGLTPHRVLDMYYFATDRPNHWIDISSVIEPKKAALRCHESQTKHKDLDKWIREKGLVAGIEQKLKCAEAFHHYVV
ncbi:PIG-L family deacetylase [Ktedonosporobacter rubrisoli]|uniref:PIG-L family deacetylase n=1 Tax=Ktedonosporobacter rubrisoli TaxID=2509675 RepID=A0A4V0YZP5_KTERU|nr:PIG-L deacetylase family protein [Ktedonosporobacter rubrisoli]QBD80441.1 PIG-L family deacetylase [Ktedonosporobacter rubrisoli]